MRMLHPTLTAAALTIVTAAAGAQLEGKTVILDAGGQDRVNAPVELSYSGPQPDSSIYLERAGTGKRIPATVRDGTLTFVPEGAAAGGTYTYTVRMHGDKRPGVVQFRKHEGEDAVDVLIRDKHFTTYYYSNDEKKPYLWPVKGEGGATLTRDWPMGDRVKSADHVHHKSMWTAYGNLNGADCWAEGRDSGFQHSQSVVWKSGDAYGWLHADNVWQDQDHNPVIDESREYRFYAGPDSIRLVDVTVTFTASYGEVKFGDTKEGGLVAVRMHDKLIEEGGTGTITTSAGNVGAGEAWGQPAAWCDYSGTLEGVGERGLAIFDHPSNLRHPTTWHVRDYGLMGANCFGYSYFTDGEKNGDYTLDDGESITFQYRVYVHSGDVEEADVAGRYADFANPPQASWGSE